MLFIVPLAATSPYSDAALAILKYPDSMHAGCRALTSSAIDDPLG